MDGFLSLDEEVEINVDDVLISEDNFDDLPIVNKGIEALSEKALVGDSGLYLGLDISKSSTGICIYENGSKSTYNSSLTLDKDNPHWEVLLRRELKADLAELCQGKTFDLIVIEDVFEGENPQTARMLYALNTAIDELILDDVVSCKTFIRVNNQRWKSWLYKVDATGEYKGWKDKIRIEKCLELLGVKEEGTGYQDRLDATGMILGYLMERKLGSVSSEQKEKKPKLSFSDIEYAYAEDQEMASMVLRYDLDEVKIKTIKDKKFSKKSILEICNSDVESIYMTENPVKLGTFGGMLDLPVFEEGGYFAFRVSTKARNRYKREIERVS